MIVLVFLHLNLCVKSVIDGSRCTVAQGTVNPSMSRERLADSVGIEFVRPNLHRLHSGGPHYHIHNVYQRRSQRRYFIVQAINRQSKFTMVYDWENKEEICYRMYIEEKKSLEEIMEYMKEELKFAPR